MNRPFLLVLGMHRSGTSFLTRALNLCGVNLGELKSLASHEWIGKSDNLRGHWENQQVVQLSEETLALSNGSWDNPPEKIFTNEKIRDEVKQIFEKLESFSTLLSVVKDPRIILCFDSWREFLPKNICVIGIFRHPLDVVESLKIRNNFSVEKSLDLWEVYNEELLKILEKNDGFLLDFNWPKEKLFEEMNLICKKFGLPQRDLSDWFTLDLIHHKNIQEDFHLPDNIIKLYSKLKDKAKKNSSIMISPSFSEENRTIMSGFLDQIKSQEEYIKKIHEGIKKENSSLTNSIRKLNEASNQKDEQISKMNEASNQKDEQISKLNEALKNIENSTTWKWLRKYDNFKKLFSKEN